ncbi:MAG: HAD family hydrolase [Actinomycetota bacterium]
MIVYRARMIVGFDLDLTLVDSRRGIAASLVALSEETGVAIDPDIVAARIGPKLETELAHWFPDAQVALAAAAYRRHYWDHCVGAGTTILPGARASIAAVHAEGGTVLAITAKSEPLSHRCLEHVDLRVDLVVGHVHGDEKRDALMQHGVHVYVGDTIADIEAGVGAGVVSVGVTTGMHDARQLERAGADVVLTSLAEFPAWFSSIT